MASIKEILTDILDLTKQTVKVGKTKIAAIEVNGTVSNTVDVGDYFPFLHIVIPTITSAQLELQVSEFQDGTFQDFGQDALTVAGTGAFSDTWVLGGWRFIRIKSSVSQTSRVVFYVRGVTY